MSPPRIGFIGLGRMGRPMAFTGDLGNEPEATSISDRGLFRFLARNLSPGVFSDFCNKICHNRTTLGLRI